MPTMDDVPRDVLERVGRLLYFSPAATRMAAASRAGHRAVHGGLEPSCPRPPDSWKYGALPHASAGRGGWCHFPEADKRLRRAVTEVARNLSDGRELSVRTDDELEIATGVPGVRSLVVCLEGMSTSLTTFCAAQRHLTQMDLYIHSLHADRLALMLSRLPIEHLGLACFKLTGDLRRLLPLQNLRDLNLSNMPVHDAEVVGGLLSGLPGLVVLSIANILVEQSPGDTATVLAPIARMRRLRGLDVCGNSLGSNADDRDRTALKRLTADLPRLVNLRMSQNPVGDARPPLPAALWRLELSNTQVDGRQLADELPQSLGVLHLAHNNIANDRGVLPAVLRAIPPTLTELDLSGNAIGRARRQVSLLAEALGRLTGLRHLAIRENPLSRDLVEVSALGEAIGRLTSLRHLDLGACGGSPLLLFPLDRLARLTVLKIDCSCIGCDAQTVDAACRLLAGSPDLEILDLSGNPLAPSGTLRLFEAIGACSKLEMLCLVDTMLTGVHTPVIRATLARLPSLETVLLQGTHLPVEDAASLI